MNDAAPVGVAHLHANAEWGGGENQILALLEGGRSRPEVDMVLFTKAGGALCERARAAGCTVVPVRMAKWVPACLTAWGIARYCRLHGIRIVHAHDSGSLDLALWVRRWAGVRVVYTRRVASVLRRNLRSRGKYSPRRIDCLVCVSETVRNVMLRDGFPSAQLRVIPSAVDVLALGMVEPAEDLKRRFAGRRLAGGIGKLAPKKNWSFLIRTAAACRDAGVPVEWVLAGDGPEQPSLEALVRELTLEAHIHFLGFRSDATCVLRALDVLFFPSTVEGASVTVREAMALGVPVVAVDSAGVVESLDGCGWVVADGDVAAAAGCLREVLEAHDLRADRIQAAKASVIRRFDLPVMVNGYIGLYQEWGS